jgi:hypothetical protein
MERWIASKHWPAIVRSYLAAVLMLLVCGWLFGVDVWMWIVAAKVQGLLGGLTAYVLAKFAERTSRDVEAQVFACHAIGQVMIGLSATLVAHVIL